MNLRFLYIYLTWECNLFCKHCWVSAGESYKEMHKSINYRKIIDQANLLGLEFIKISGGEPLIKEDTVRDIIEYAKQYSIDIFLETNCTLMTDDFASFLKKNNCGVSVSIDGDKDIHNRMRGSDKAYELMENGVQILVSNGLIPNVVHSFIKFNVVSFGAVINFMKKYCLTNLKLNPIMNLGRAENLGIGSQALSMSALDLLKIKNKYCSTRNDNINVQMMLPLCYEGYSMLFKDKVNMINCPYKNIISILPDGTVGLCGEAKDIKELQYGNIFENDLIDIWQTGKELHYIHSLDNQEKYYGICSRCILFDKCGGGCRVVALKGSNVVNGSNPLCEELYKKGAFPFLKNGNN